jgi:hypothetical protein
MSIDENLKVLERLKMTQSNYNGVRIISQSNSKLKIKIAGNLLNLLFLVPLISFLYVFFPMLVSSSKDMSLISLVFFLVFSICAFNIFWGIPSTFIELKCDQILIYKRLFYIPIPITIKQKTKIISVSLHKREDNILFRHSRQSPYSVPLIIINDYACCFGQELSLNEAEWLTQVISQWIESVSNN